ncbi:discoidin domain-containing protein [uncultured Treponema sp.]|uniref:discoidin domain-containing protein n=1 Tax=uncultured Treponema sp. TaxID=162155 RepID=UPI0025FD54C5|nr:discoidin domain-containing protein [uncultured Treponema sp.]
MKKVTLFSLCAGCLLSLGLCSCGSSEEESSVVYASLPDDLANSKNYTAVKGYASSNLRQSKTTPVSVNNLTDGSTSVQSYALANTTGGDKKPWFAIDLGSVKSFNSIRIVPGCGQDAEESYPDAYPVHYKIQFSMEKDGISSPDSIERLSWMTICEVKDGTLSAKTLHFENKESRWVRVLVEQYNGDYCGLLEISVFPPDTSRTLESLGKATNVLFIGNSLTYYNNMWSVFEGLSRFRGHNVNATAVTFGGKNLIYHSTAHNTETAIKAGNFDYIVMQDICGSFTDDKLTRGSAALVPKILEHNPNAKLVYYATWPKYSVRDDRTAEFTQCYLDKAQKYNALIAPAGEAFYDLSKTNGVSYYDSGDDTHPQPIGSFLSASTFFHTIFPQDGSKEYTDEDVKILSKLINSYVSDSTSGKSTTYDKALLTQIDKLSKKYAEQIAPAAADPTGTTKYTSVAGEYNK